MPASYQFPLKHTAVVVPVDFSVDSFTAVRAGLDRVKDPAHLHVVHVLFPLDIVSASTLGELADDRPYEETALRKLRELIQEAGAEGAQAVVLVGDPGLETVDYAKKVGADLIVVPSHGYHGVKRLLLGSTAERIIRHAHCAVLVLRRSDAD